MITGADLNRLSRIALLGKVDLSPRGVFISPGDGYVTATYRGSYSAGTLRVDTMHFPESVVYAEQLRNVASLFGPEESIDVRLKGADVVLQTEDKEVKLRQLGASTFEDALEVPASESVVTAPVSSLASDIALASNFCSTSPRMPLFGGVRLLSSGKGLVVSAFNGTSALFLSRIEKATVTASIDVTVPANDLLTAFEVLDGRDVDLRLVKGTGKGEYLSLVSESCIVNSAIIAGEWPDVSKLARGAARRTAVTIDSEKLSLITSATKALNAQEVLVFEVGEDKKLVIRTRATDFGTFSAKVGEMSQPINVAIDSHLIKLAARIGTEVVIELPNDRSPVLIHAGTRRFWAPVMVSKEES